MSVQMNELESGKLSEIVAELSELHSIATQLADMGENYDRFTLRQLDDHIINLHQISLDITHHGLQAVCGKLRDNIHHHILAGTFLSEQEIGLITEWKSLVKAYVTNPSNDKVIHALMDNLAKQNWPLPLGGTARLTMDTILRNPFTPPEEHVDLKDSKVSTLEDISTTNDEQSDGTAEPVSEDSVDEETVPLSTSNQSDSEENADEIDLLDELEEYDADLDAVFDLNDDDNEQAGVDLSVTIETSYKDVSELMSDETLIDQIYEDNDELEEHSLSSYFDSTESVEPENAEPNAPFIDPVENAMTEMFAPEKLRSDLATQSEDTEDVTEPESQEPNAPFVDSAENAMTEMFAPDKIRSDLSPQPDDAENTAEPPSDAAKVLEDELFTPADEPVDDESSIDEGGIAQAENVANGFSEHTSQKFRELFSPKPNADDSDDDFANENIPVDEVPSDESLSIEDELFAPSEEADDSEDATEKYDEDFNKDLDQAAQETQHELEQIKLIGLNDSTPKEREQLELSENEQEVFTSAQESVDISFDDSAGEDDFVRDLSAVSEQEESTGTQDPPADADADLPAPEDTKLPASDIQDLEEELIEKNYDVGEQTPQEQPAEESDALQESPSIDDSAWSDEQKELLSLIVAEVQDTISQQPEVTAVFDAQPVNEESVRDVLSLYAEQVERMGSAADMVGLTALQKISDLLHTHFNQLNRAGIDQIVLAKDKIMQWPSAVLKYLSNIYSSDCQKHIVKYIADSGWISPISEEVKNSLLNDFSNSTIKVETAKDDRRIKVASAQDVSVAVPDDVQVELLDGMLQELPHQTEEFSTAVQGLIEDGYLQQLEITQRIAHTIKGAANTVGIKGVATLTHNLEDILQALLKALAKPNKQLHEALVDAADCLEQMTECLLGTGDEPKDAVTTLQTILDWANYIDEFGPPPEINSTSESTQEKPIARQEPVTVNKSNDKNKVVADAALRVPANIIDELLKQSGESIITASQMQEQIDHALAQLRDMKINKDSVLALSQQLEHLIDIQGIASKQLTEEQGEKFDPLEMDQYNELHTFSRRLMEATEDSVELVKQLEDRIIQLEASVAAQLRAQKEYQHAVLTTRMVPVESIVPRLKRGVRQTAKISGKSVELTVSGVETLVDSKILNNLIDPLMHLLRNSVDHGIEPEDVRIAKGKAVQGQIDLSFVQEGDRIVVTCSDDGQGLDTELIRARAIEKQIIDEDENLSDDEIYQLIMRHGLSTRTEVTQLSGRGVGMDVVYSSIKELNGSISVSSQPDAGTTIELAFPVSLLSVHALLVKVNARTIAVSTHGIEEILQAQATNLFEEGGQLYLKVEEDAYPAVHIEELLGVSVKKDVSNQNYTAFLVNQIGEQQKVVLVDRVISTNEIVIKPFSRYLPKILGIIGATVLGNGEIATVVDVIDLLSQENVYRYTDDARLLEEESDVQRVVALIVEDSISTRKSLAEFMQDLNYEVYTAKDGVEAIEVMRKRHPNIVLTDLEMPRMNGLELTSHLRSNEDTKNIPVIMITSRTTEKHRREAEAIGVNEYLSKPYQEDVLLAKVQQLAPIG